MILNVDRYVRTKNFLSYSDRFGIHTIGFGSLVDARMLRRIAAQNVGTSIQIFIDIDTHVQVYRIVYNFFFLDNKCENCCYSSHTVQRYSFLA